MVFSPSPLETFYPRSLNQDDRSSRAPQRYPRATITTRCHAWRNIKLMAEHLRPLFGQFPSPTVQWLRASVQRLELFRVRDHGNGRGLPSRRLGVELLLSYQSLRRQVYSTLRGTLHRPDYSNLQIVQKKTSTVGYSQVFIRNGDIWPILGSLWIKALRWPAMGSNIAFEIW